MARLLLAMLGTAIVLTAEASSFRMVFLVGRGRLGWEELRGGAEPKPRPSFCPPGNYVAPGSD